MQRMSGSTPDLPSDSKAASSDAPPPSAAAKPVVIPSDEELLGPARRGPTPLSESPWFWAYLFATAGLIALALAAPKFGVRQAAIEREYQGRTRAAENLNGRDPSLEMSTPDQTIITLQPLFFYTAAISAVAWGVFWYTRRRALSAASSSLSNSQETVP